MINAKSNYLKDTKSAIAQAIADKGVEITEDTTFRDYATKISEIKTNDDVDYDVIVPSSTFIPPNATMSIQAGLHSGSGSFTTIEPEPEVEPIVYTGSVDVDGLKAIGWDDDDIDDFEENGIYWNAEDNDLYLVTDYDKQCYQDYLDGTFVLPATFSSIVSMATYYPYLKFSPKFDFSELTSFDYIYEKCYNLLAVPKCELGDIQKNMSYVFRYNYALLYCPNWDYSLAKVMLGTFQYCKTLRKTRFLDNVNCTALTSIFEQCTSLVDYGGMSQTASTVFQSMFANCPLLKSINIEINGSLTMNFFAQYNYSLKSVKLTGLSAATTTWYNAFYNCYNLQSIELDLSSNTTAVTALTGSPFYNCNNLKTVILTKGVLGSATASQIQYWFPYVEYLYIEDASELTSLASCCYGLTNLKYVKIKGVDNVTNMSSAFYGCTALQTIEIEGETSQITNWSSTFYNCYSLQKYPDVDMSGANNMSSTFQNNYSAQDNKAIDLSKVTTLANAYYNNYIKNGDYGDVIAPLSITSAAMFYACYGLTSVGDIELEKATTMLNMFYQTYNLQSCGDVIAPLCTTSATMFSNSGVKSIGDISLSIATTSESMFLNCYNLEEIGDIYVPLSVNIKGLFNGCQSLKKVGYCDFSKITSTSYLDTTTFLTCINLEEIYIKGITCNFSLTNSPKLTKECLIYMIDNLPTSSSARVFTIGETNKAKLTDEEIAIAVEKNWTIA